MLYTIDSTVLILILSQKAFNEEFYDEGEDEKPVFEDDLDDEPGKYWIDTAVQPLESSL